MQQLFLSWFPKFPEIMYLLDLVEKYLAQGNKLFMRDWAPSKDNFKLAR